MWKPAKLAGKTAVVFEASVHGRKLLVDNLRLMRISEIANIVHHSDLSRELNKLPYDLVFVDWGTDAEVRQAARQALKEWKNNRRNSQVLIMTSHAPDKANVDACMDCGCDALILKPYSPRVFCDSVAWANASRNEVKLQIEI